MSVLYDLAWFEKTLGKARGRSGDFLTECPVCSSRDNLHVGPKVYPDGRAKVQCKGCGALLPDVLGALNADGRNGTGPKVRRVSNPHDEEQPVVQAIAHRRDPKAWLAAKTGVTPEFLDALPVSFSGGWIRHRFDGLPVTKDRQAGTRKRRWAPKEAHCPPIWPLDAVMPDEALFTEGETDCIAVRFLLDADNVYAVTKGASGTPTPIEWKALRDRGLRHAVFAFDADAEGRAGTDRAIEDALAAGLDVSSVTPPTYDPLTGTGKDWTEWIAAGGTADSFPSLDRDDGFTTYDDLRTSEHRAVAWIARGWIAHRALTLLAGPPKGGKSTLLSDLAAALGDGTPFLGQDVTRTPVLVMTEEEDSTLWEKAEGALQHVTFLKQARETLAGRTFAQSLARAAAKCRRDGIRVLVIDTLAAWAGFEDENNASKVIPALNLVRAVASQGVAVVLVHHTKKGGGAHGEGIRGSSALFAAPEIVIEQTYVSETSRERTLTFHSRYAGEWPELRVTRDLDAPYRLLGSEQQVRSRDDEKRIAALPTDPGITREAVEALWGMSQRSTEKYLATYRKWQRVDVHKPASGRGTTYYRVWMPEPRETPDD